MYNTNICEGTVTINLVHVQNAAHNPLTILPLSPNFAYESHMYQDSDDQDEYEYMSSNMTLFG